MFPNQPKPSKPLGIVDLAMLVAACNPMIVVDHLLALLEMLSTMSTSPKPFLAATKTICHVLSCISAIETEAMPAYSCSANRNDHSAQRKPGLVYATEKARYTSSNPSLQSSCVTPTKDKRLLYQLQLVQRLR